MLDVQPRTVRVTLDQVVKQLVDVRVDVAPLPAGVQRGQLTVTPTQVTVRGAQSDIQRVDAVVASVAAEPSGIDIDREVAPVAVDASGATIGGIDIEPSTVHVKLPLFRNLESRGLPINAVITGSPGVGFRVASIDQPRPASCPSRAMPTTSCRSRPSTRSPSR